MTYPRPKGRGSIAAPSPASPPCSTWATIHGRKAVAPLRQDHGQERSTGDVVPYPRPKGRGSLRPPQDGNTLDDVRHYPRPKGRGSIAATALCPGRARSGSAIHGRKAVAPLRRSSPKPSAEPSPALLSTAERPWLHCGVDAQGRVGHVVDCPRPKGRGSIAAGRGAGSRSPGTYPRPKDRGSIAAASSRRPCRDGHRRYPRPKGRGSIAASRPSTGPRARCTRYPRPKGRGSIAADQKKRGCWPRRTAAIHGRKAVAPLRQAGGFDRGRTGRPTIHGRKAVAPLRRTSTRIGAPALNRSYPRPKGRGSIAAPRRAAHTWTPAHRLSTAEGRGSSAAPSRPGRAQAHCPPTPRPKRPWLHCGAVCVVSGAVLLVTSYPRPKGRCHCGRQRSSPCRSCSSIPAIPRPKGHGPVRLHQGTRKSGPCATSRPKGRGSIAASCVAFMVLLSWWPAITAERPWLHYGWPRLRRCSDG